MTRLKTARPTQRSTLIPPLHIMSRSHHIIDIMIIIGMHYAGATANAIVDEPDLLRSRRLCQADRCKRGAEGSLQR